MAQVNRFAKLLVIKRKVTVNGRLHGRQNIVSHMISAHKDDGGEAYRNSGVALDYQCTVGITAAVEVSHQIAVEISDDRCAFYSGYSQVDNLFLSSPA